MIDTSCVIIDCAEFAAEPVEDLKKFKVTNLKLIPQVTSQV